MVSVFVLFYAPGHPFDGHPTWGPEEENLDHRNDERAPPNAPNAGGVVPIALVTEPRPDRRT